MKVMDNMKYIFQNADHYLSEEEYQVLEALKEALDIAHLTKPGLVSGLMTSAICVMQEAKRLKEPINRAAYLQVIDDSHDTLMYIKRIIKQDSDEYYEF